MTDTDPRLARRYRYSWTGELTDQQGGRADHDGAECIITASAEIETADGIGAYWIRFADGAEGVATEMELTQSDGFAAW